MKSRQALIDYLYSNEAIINFMCNDMYQELLECISIDKCICDENANDNIRQNNLNFVKGAIKGFVVGNKQYQNILFGYYNHNDIEPIVYDVLIGLVLYISCTIDEFNDIDILIDARSICYGENYILDKVC